MSKVSLVGIGFIGGDLSDIINCRKHYDKITLTENFAEPFEIQGGTKCLNIGLYGGFINYFDRDAMITCMKTNNLVDSEFNYIFEKEEGSPPILTTIDNF